MVKGGDERCKYAMANRDLCALDRNKSEIAVNQLVEATKRRKYFEICFPIEIPSLWYPCYIKVVFLVYAVLNCLGMAVWLVELELKVLHEDKTWTEVKAWFDKKLGRWRNEVVAFMD